MWEEIRQAGAGRFPGVEGRIPNFVGAEAAAARAASLPEWRRATTVKANPDSPQWPARTRALEDGKVLYMAVPRLRDERPFWQLDPDRLEVAPRRACSIKGAAIHGRPVSLEEMASIDLVLCGSVAVDRTGARLGKGGGYSDLEFALAAEFGKIGPATVTLTTVHPVQLIASGQIPLEDHDSPVDVIVTPDRVWRTESVHPRPPGIFWERLDRARVDQIPALRR